MNPRSRAFTLIELAVVVLAVVLAVAVLGSCLGHGHPVSADQRDAQHLRSILQSMVLWAGNNNDQYPLPSQLDADGATIAGPAADKDTTANIYSILIYNGFYLEPDEFVSPAEVGNIRRDNDYQTSAPAAAVDPKRALWDPAFRADFTGRQPGNTSYAHLAPADAGSAGWTYTFSAERAVIANRGPQVTSVTYGADGPAPTLANPKSNTLRIHGSRTQWEGNVGYDDNHVDFETHMAPADIFYTTAAGTRQRDTLFFDEPDDPAGDNNFLTITIPAAGVPGGRAIWD